MGSGHGDSGIVRGRGRGPVRGGETDAIRRGQVKRNATSPVWAALHLRCWERIRSQLLRKMLRIKRKPQTWV